MIQHKINIKAPPQTILRYSEGESIASPNSQLGGGFKLRKLRRTTVFPLKYCECSELRTLVGGHLRLFPAEGFLGS